MRSLLPSTPFLALAAALVAVPVGTAFAQQQDKAATEAQQPQPKQVTLTQQSLDGLVAAQKQIRDIESKMPKDAKGPDPKVEAQIETAVKKNGFTSVEDFANASYSVGMVLAGMDPDTGKYIGAEAATKKQIDEVKSDKQMPPKEKKEALDELNESLKQVASDKPMQGNIDLVTANMSKLDEGLKQSD